MSFFVLKCCLFVPKFTYVLRCSLLWKHQTHLELLDETVRTSLVKIFNCQINNEAWNFASLPVRFGGIGVRRASDVALPAFLSSAYASSSLCGNLIGSVMGPTEVCGVAEAREAWLQKGMDTLPSNLCSQKQWDNPLCKKIKQTKIAQCTRMEDRCRLLALTLFGCRHSHPHMLVRFLTTVPFRWLWDSV